jgi:glyoxylase-like metal-dependent hydrolase (beta-lactamase superfamily II)
MNLTGFLSRVFAVCLFLAPIFVHAAVQKIAPDLYAYVSDNDGSSNSTFLVTAQGILVVDTGVNAQEGRKLLTEIRRISTAPVLYIVNTHYHPDHRGANSVIGPEATVISTVFTRDRQSAGISSEGDSLAITGSLTLFFGGHEIDIVHPGPAHTPGDVYIYFRNERAVATGDLFLTNCSPAMDDGDMENWIAALDSILALPAETFVPGHFQVASKQQVRRFRDYLGALRSQVESMFRAGKSLPEVQAGLKMKEYEDFRQYPQYDATIASNAATYFQQLKSKASPRSH